MLAAVCVGPAVAGCVPADPACGFFGMSHRVEGYIVYTCNHLPMLSCRPVLDKKEDANVASFAARIAFSSFPIRSRLR